jgi:hypothetical protein
MSNTLIQIKRSLATAVPPNGSLAVGQEAYSYSSNTLFIGAPDGVGVIAVGGKYYIDTVTAAFAAANAAFSAANTGTGIGAAFAQANASFAQANSASATANAAIVSSNAAFAKANTANITADLAFAQGNSASAIANAAFASANAGQATANASFVTANNALPKAGGTVSGDLIVTGNLTISGCTTYSNTNTLLVGDNIFVLNADLPSTASPSEDAGMQVNRGNQSNVGLIWIEAAKQWSMQVNTGISRWLVANTELEAANAIAIAAFAAANAGLASANAGLASANAGMAIANAAFASANAGQATANAAFARANTANITADLAFAKANTANITADLAFLRSNQAFALANSATAQAANATFLTTGTVGTTLLSGSYTGITGVGTITAGVWNSSTAITVPYGGTGATTLTLNGVLIGNGTSPVSSSASGTEGQVLQASSTGVPNFSMLDGGSF